jgi:hypothetical protein
MLLRLVFGLLTCFFCCSGFSQERSVQAIKAVYKLKIDGSLDDEAWKQAPTVSEFIQNYPAFGQPSATKSVVKILYDNEAIYVGAYLYDDPQQIRSQLTSRDGEQRQDVDYFSVFFDTYHDQQNGFQFLVTSANVQTDARLGGNVATNFGEYGDKAWDAVWQSKTSIKADGWVAEIRIPYISLRFAKKEVQTWGLQFLRFTRRNNEASFWNPVNPNLAGFVNQFGRYGDLKNIQPPLRLSFSPYLSTGVRRTPMLSGSKTEWLRSGGMDVKYGINESFTLDATLIPDFGQVISDNIVNNITPYEIRFTENRPFFTEGTELFNKAGLFYSRRIGDVPSDYSRVHHLVRNDTAFDLVKNPVITQLYNAIKLSGRTRKKLGIGVFNAVTAPAHAVLHHRPIEKDTTLETEPLTNYNIIVLDQAFKGQSYLTFTNTNVIRNGNLRDANVSALNFAAYDNTNTYSLSGSARYSSIFGLTPYNSITSPYTFISHLDTVTVKDRLYAKPYDGFKANINLGKVSGRIQFGTGVSMETEGYDPNDLGFLNTPNGISYSANVGYNQFTPTRNFISYNYQLTALYNWMFRPYVFSGLEVIGNATWVFKNFWDVTLRAGSQPFWQNDYFELQTTGAFVKKPPYWYATVNGSTDSRKRLFFSYQFTIADGGVFANNLYFQTRGGLRYRFSNKFSVSVEADRRHDKLQIGYAYYNDPDGRPVLGFRDYKDLNAVLSGSYNFTSRMNITFRARHYWNAVHYLSFYNVKEDGYYITRDYLPDNNQNFNAFNIDAFFTWDFRPGSRVIAGYKNSLGSDYLFDLSGNTYKKWGSNFMRTFTLPHANELTLRLIYFLDYNQFRQRQ